jgi:AraC-like DNA-binding protein
VAHQLNIDHDKIAVLLTLDHVGHGWKKRLENLVDTAMTTLDRDYNLRVTCGIGTVFSDLTEASSSYNEALYALESRASTDTARVVWHAAVPGNGGNFHYPIETEVRLINLSRAGSQEAQEELLQRVYKENFEKRTLTMAQCDGLVSGLRGTVGRVERHMAPLDLRVGDQVRQAIAQAEQCASPGEAFDVIRTCFQLLCAEANRRKKSHNDVLRERILQYIEESYRQPDLSLYSVSSRFDVTEKYLSEFFKEQVGEGFSSYVTGLRIKRAQEIIRGHRATLDVVARHVGYHSVNTFYRAFKRKCGVSPRQYRDAV